MDLRGEGVLPAPPDKVMAYVGDLSTYPDWLGIVLAVRVDVADPVNEPAWLVDLGARLGPLKKSKRVRMVRTVLTDNTVRFERQEQDDREHSPWVLDGHVARAPAPAAESPGATLTMHLHYGGSAWLPGLELLLNEEVRRATGRLARLVG